MVMVNLVTKQLAYRKIIRETDYTPRDLSGVTIKENKYKDPFLLPTKDYAPMDGGDAMWEPMYDVNIEETDKELVVTLNENVYSYNKNTQWLSFNGISYEPDDDECKHHKYFVGHVIAAYGHNFLFPKIDSSDSDD